ncbi:VOC family protein [Chondromyces crocatus]|uniref:Glyoxalase n=1 Tax=Chondromyces crocatus TaxID=52 RepID=A0A0K1EBJ8_CHOCO|nr:VOC family protein [Chondromyces crocatus]AKT37953.1 glyoxalase [Chondromyces crocatus]
MTTTPRPPFHLAFPVTALETTRHFYRDVLGCALGRESDRWIDFDFFGHQITAHLVEQADASVATNPVDGDDIPVRHFGAVLPWDDWHALRDRLREAGVRFLVEPHVRFPGEVGEQATMFIKDPSGNALEFKSFKDLASLFART